MVLRRLTSPKTSTKSADALDNQLDPSAAYNASVEVEATPHGQSSNLTDTLYIQNKEEYAVECYFKDRKFTRASEH